MIVNSKVVDSVCFVVLISSNLSDMIVPTLFIPKALEWDTNLLAKSVKPKWENNRNGKYGLPIGTNYEISYLIT